MKQNTNEQPKKRLAVYARLASIETLDTLKEWERHKLLDDVQQAGFRFPDTLSESRTDGELSQWDVVTHIHARVRALITDFVDGKEVSLHPLSACDHTRVQMTPRGTTHLIVSGDGPLRDEMLAELGQILRQNPSPFRRCPVCRVVFVPGKNQKYCTPACTTRGNETARKDARRTYMRKYMAEQRAHTKKQPAPVVKTRGTPLRKGEN